MIYDFVRMHPNYKALRVAEHSFRFIFNIYLIIIVRSWCHRLKVEKKFRGDLCNANNVTHPPEFALPYEIREQRFMFGGMNPRIYYTHTNVTYPYSIRMQKAPIPHPFSFPRAVRAVDQATTLEGDGADEGEDAGDDDQEIVGVDMDDLNSPPPESEGLIHLTDAKDALYTLV